MNTESTNTSYQLNTGDNFEEVKENVQYQSEEIASLVKKFVSGPGIIKFFKAEASNRNKKKVEEGYERLSDSKAKGNVRSDILDKYENAIISEKTIYEGKEIYKVINNADNYILKVVDIDINDESSKAKLKNIEGHFKIMKSLSKNVICFINTAEIRGEEARPIHTY